MPPVLPRDSEEWQRPAAQRGCGWALLQGQAGTPSRPLPASWPSFPDCLPPSSRGRRPLIWAYLLPIECFLFVFAAASGKQMGWGGRRNWTSEWGLSQGRGPLLWALLLRSVLVLSPDLPTALCPGPAAADSYLLGSPPLTETLHASPLVLKDQAKLQTPGYDIRAPQKPGLCCSPILPGALSSPQKHSPLPQISLQVPALTHRLS